MAESGDVHYSQSYLKLDELVCHDPTAFGVAIIIANDYDNDRCKKKKLESIKGPMKDAIKAEKVFKSLNTTCYTLLNCTSPQIIEALQAAASYPYPGTYEWIVVMFSGHGKCFVDSGCQESELSLLYAQNGETISVQFIVDLFQPKSSSLNGKIPKLFFIDACRGKEEADSVLVSRGETNQCLQIHIPREGKTLETLRLPSECNTLVGYSTLPRKIAYEADNGGLWMSFLLDRLEKQDNSVVEILTEVNGDVVQRYQDIDGKMQMPKYHSTLLHSVCFKRSVQVKGQPLMTVQMSSSECSTNEILFTKKLNQFCKGNVIKNRKYTDHQGDGHHVSLIITLASDGTEVEFNSSTISPSFDCINDAREAVAGRALEFIQENYGIVIFSVPLLKGKGSGLPQSKECVQELKDSINGKKMLETPPTYKEVPHGQFIISKNAMSQNTPTLPVPAPSRLNKPPSNIYIYKEKLNNYFHGQLKKELPTYTCKVVDEGFQCFISHHLFDREFVGKIGATKKEAENSAAKKAWTKMMSRR